MLESVNHLRGSCETCTLHREKFTSQESLKYELSCVETQKSGNDIRMATQHAHQDVQRQAVTMRPLNEVYQINA
jgi:hypothetical protein